PDDISGDYFLHAWVQCNGPESARDCADAPFHAVREDLGENVSKSVAVFEPFLKAPIWLIDVLLDAPAVEGAIGESVDGEDIKTIPGEEIFEFGKRFLVREILGCDRRKPKPNSHGMVRRSFFFYLWQIFAKRRTRFWPGLSAMNVGAIGQV